MIWRDSLSLERFRPSGKRAKPLTGVLGALLLALGVWTYGPAAAAEDPDEAELSQHFSAVEVWHYPVAYDVGYNGQDVVVTRELVALPPPSGKLCFIRFDLVRGEGDYSYGFKPSGAGGPANDKAWGVYAHKRGTVTDQLRSVLKLNVIYFFVDGPKTAQNGPSDDICAQKQAASAHAYTAPEWSDLVVRAKLLRGWPATATP
ncbi:hypothetical protein [Methylocystis bryophila]|uniref:hypothetical protein n=1 Tax=Methylocystis bryophila TaxID=655015 RepID=UPI0024906EBB|nr:hypothetical protein [Methylocystis bryophila]BDV38383.1 hypothetical protein DSM21852_16360 [Methylocystis bryophila]